MNFAKSSIFRVNVGKKFMELAREFLNCKVCSRPFKYLGLAVEASPKKVGI